MTAHEEDLGWVIRRIDHQPGLSSGHKRFPLPFLLAFNAEKWVQRRKSLEKEKRNGSVSASIRRSMDTTSHFLSFSNLRLTRLPTIDAEIDRKHGKSDGRR